MMSYFYNNNYYYLFLWFQNLISLITFFCTAYIEYRIKNFNVMVMGCNDIYTKTRFAPKTVILS